MQQNAEGGKCVLNRSSTEFSHVEFKVFHDENLDFCMHSCIFLLPTIQSLGLQWETCNHLELGLN